LIWQPNDDHDIVGYLAFRSDSEDGFYKRLISTPIVENHYIDTGLEEDTEYFYKLKAVDDADLRSDYSNSVSGRTLLGPEPPEVIIPFQDFSIVEDSYSDDKIILFDIFEDVNDDPLFFECTGNENIDVTIYQWNGTVVLKPKVNWNGKETLIFSATDDNISFAQDSVEVTVTAVNDPPFNANIYSVQPGYYINGYPQFTGNCEDPDILYGDELSFSWYTDNEVLLGEGKQLGLEPYTLDVGIHRIKLVVTDSDGLSIETAIDIEISNLPDVPPKINEPTDDGENKGLITVGITLAVVVAVILFALFFIIRRRKNDDRKDNEENVAQPVQPSAQPAQPEQLPHTPQASQAGVQVPAIAQQPIQQPDNYPLPQQDQSYQELPAAGEPDQDYTEQSLNPDLTLENTQEPISEPPIQEQSSATDYYSEPEEAEEQDTLLQEQSSVEQDASHSVACPTCGAQIAVYTTPCPGCNTILNW
jgi:hypothetical protein